MEASTVQATAEQASSTAAPLSNGDRSRERVLRRIEELDLGQHLKELEIDGFTVVPNVLSSDQIDRATMAILRYVERHSGNKLNLETAASSDFHGMMYQHYLLFEDDVFPEIMLEPAPLALLHYLLGESCVLSSMGSHLRGPGGFPLPFHADGPAMGMNEVAQVANCNYALTRYSAAKGGLTLIPNSHRLNRQPNLHENWHANGEPIAKIMQAGMSAEVIDELEWMPPHGAVTLDVDPGDAVIWHGNTWHGGWRRDERGLRVNLAAYFCRAHVATQERRGDDRHPEVFEKYANDPLFAKLMGQRLFDGWQEEGPDLSGATPVPRGLYD